MREHRENHIKNINYIEKVFLSKSIEKSLEEIEIASKYIKQLNDFIDDKIQLSEKRIYLLLNYLYSNHSLHLSYELKDDIGLRRARKYEEINSKIKHCLTQISELSVIPDEKKDIIKIGRLNKEQEPIYYACMSENNFYQYDVALSEVDAMEMDYINYLDSITIGYLNVVHIGTFDLFIKGQKLPTWIDSYSLELFEFFKSECEKRENKYLLESHQLCSAFFADILSRKNYKNLYKVTSVLADIIFEKKSIDAIVYESVQVKGAPVIAIKPESLNKIEHKEVASLMVDSNMGYGIYYVKVINKGKVKENQLVWGSTENEQ